MSRCRQPLFRDLRPTTGHIRLFLLLSLAVHGLVLTVDGHPKLIRQPVVGSPALAVRLEPAAHAQAVGRLAATTSVATSNWRLPTVPEATQDTAMTEDRTNSSTTSQATAGAMLESYLLGRLQHELSRYLRYPQLARERGWQGTVVIGVAVAPSGALSGTRLLQSSGYALLDEVSLAGLRHVRHLPFPVPHSGMTAPVEVVLPIRFRLTDNS